MAGTAVLQTCTINYNANGGSGAPSATVKTASVLVGSTYSVTLSSTKPTRTGYTFKGWSQSSSATSASYSAGGTFSFTVTTTANRTFTLYAVWEAKTYTIRYRHGNYASEQNYSTTKTYGVAIYLRGETYTRSGYRQTGWSPVDEGYAAYEKKYNLGAKYSTNADLDVYPYWEATTSSLSVNNGVLGNEMTIGVNRSNPSYTHTITYTYGSATGTIVTKSSEETIRWTPPISMSSEFPNSSSGKCTFKITTYNGSTSLGSQTKDITLSVPDSIKVSITDAVIEEAVEEIHDKFNAYIQGYSKFKITTNVDDSEAYGATVLSITVVLSGSSTTQTLFGSPVTSDIIQSHGDISYSVTVKDTRGRTSSIDGTINVVPHINPYGSLILVRDSTGSRVDVVYSWNIDPLNDNNDKIITIKYKEKNGGNWTTAATIIPETYSGEAVYSIVGLVAVNTYTIAVELTDYFSTTELTDNVIATGKRFIEASAHDGTISFNDKNPEDGWNHFYKRTRFDAEVDYELWPGTPNRIGGLIFDSGTIPTRSVPASSVVSVPVTFSEPFPVVPNVIAVMTVNGTSNVGSSSVAVYQITKYGFTLLFENNQTAAKVLGAEWFATAHGRTSSLVGYGVVGSMTVS